MSYVLDGIETAMVRTVTRHEGVQGLMIYHDVDIACPCGWSTKKDGWNEHAANAALRFHYTHCPQAKSSHSANK